MRQQGGFDKLRCHHPLAVGAFDYGLVRGYQLKAPTEIQRELERLVLGPKLDKCDGGDPAIKAIAQWCIESGAIDYDFEFVGVMPNQYPFDFTDQALRDYEGIDQAEPITKQQRIQYMDRCVSDAIDEGDADYRPAFGVVELEGSGGSVVYFGYSVRGYSFGEVSISGHGLFSSIENFNAAVCADGWITSVEQFAGWPMEAKLELWQ